MGVPILILGQSGSGKSTSLRNFEIEEVGVFNVASKPLPFKKKLNVMNKATYGTITTALQRGKLKRYVIDDSQYLMAFGMFAKAKEAGYGKFTDIALDFYNLLKFITDGTPEDTVVYFLHHTETTEDGRVKAKTSGKMLDNQLTLEGLFSVVLLAETADGQYRFRTQSDGCNPCKSPMGMFPLVIDNDLKHVDETIREYYNLNKEPDNNTNNNTTNDERKGA